MLSNVLVSSQLPFIRHPGTWGRVAWPVVLALGYQCSLQHPINFFLSLHYHRSTFTPPPFCFFCFFLLPFPWLQINNILRSGFIITLGAGMYVSAAWQEISFIVHLNAEHFNCKYQAIIQRLQKKKMPDPFLKPSHYHALHGFLQKWHKICCGQPESRKRNSGCVSDCLWKRQIRAVIFHYASDMSQWASGEDKMQTAQETSFLIKLSPSCAKECFVSQ